MKNEGLKVYQLVLIISIIMFFIMQAGPREEIKQKEKDTIKTLFYGINGIRETYGLYPGHSKSSGSRDMPDSCKKIENVFDLEKCFKAGGYFLENMKNINKNYIYELNESQDSFSVCLEDKCFFRR